MVLLPAAHPRKQQLLDVGGGSGAAALIEAAGKRRPGRPSRPYMLLRPGGEDLVCAGNGIGMKAHDLQ
jgi:hypothetical protein